LVKNKLTNFLKGTNLSPYHYNALLDSWSKQAIPTTQNLTATPTKYGGCGVSNAQAGIAGRATLVQAIADGGKGWTIGDGGLALDCSRPFITMWELTEDGQTLTLPLNGTYNFEIDWGEDGADKNRQFITSTTASHTYAKSGVYEVKIWGTFPQLYCYTNTVCKQLRSVEQWGDIEWTSMTNAFQGTSGLAINATDTPILSGVTILTSMFQNAVNLTGNFSGWDTSTITRMNQMFMGATNFDQDLSSWNVEKVGANYFTNMFSGTQLSLYHYNALLDSRSKQNVKTSVSTFNLP
jgi:hypothetical protein